VDSNDIDRMIEQGIQQFVSEEMKSESRELAEGFGDRLNDQVY
jgi:hypothetical protein